MSRGVLLGLLAAVLAALALRCPQLGSRPMHNDEAVNAIKFRSLWQDGSFRYDPNEHHGPTLAYFTLAWSKLKPVADFVQFTESRLRMVTVLFGVGLILLLPLLRDGLGGGGIVFAGALTALSPAMVYFSRDYIHETLLVFFTFLALAAGWRYVRTRRGLWAALAGAAVGLMQSTKETFVLALAAMAAAGMLNTIWARWADAGARGPAFRISRKHLLTAVALWIAVAVLFFSSFFANACGPLDAVRTYLPWFSRAAGDSPHVHPWHFYLSRLVFFRVRNGMVWSEGLILALAAVGAFAGFAHKCPRGAHAGFLRFLALYALVLTEIYSAIPYKTPWCLLGFWHGMILLAGAGAATLLERARRPWLKWAAAILLVAGGAHLAMQARLAAIPLSADRRNPYVYAQTSPDILRLVDKVNAVARIQPLGRRIVVEVVAPGADYWPLPWYLRAYDHVGWWSSPPPDLAAPVMILSTKLGLDPEADGTHVMAGLFELRPDAFVALYVESKLWREYLESLAKERAPGAR